MTNIIILICTTLGGFLVGKHFEKREKLRGDFLGDLCRYIKLLKNNVKGRRVELSAFNQQFAQSCSSIFAKFLLDNGSISFFSKNQRQMVQSLFATLSVTTSAQMISNLDYYEQLINAENEVVSNLVRNRFVSVKLGVLLGVMVGILLM